MAGKAEKKNKSMGKLTIQVIIPVIILFLGILVVMFQSMFEARQLVYRYIEDTAALYVEQLNTDITKINYEIITLTNKKREINSVKGIRPEDSKYYPVLNELQEQNRNLKIRYKEPSCFFVYLEEAELLITDSGSIFKDSQKLGLNGALMEALREKKGERTPYSQWYFINDSEQDYVFSRFSKNGMTMGCAIRLEDLFNTLRIDSLGYEGIPYIQDKDGSIFISSRDRDKISVEDIRNISGKKAGIFTEQVIYAFPISGIIGENRVFHIMITPSGGILEKIMRLQVILVFLAIGIIVGCILVVRVYYQRILRPMKQFVNSLKNTEEEQWINENGSNNILELEMASKEFKGLLRKIKSLKIDIYEKELARQKTELEAMQVQIRPHFYLNCLSLIHGMADVAKEEKIVHITEMLSNYMRYVMSDTFEPRSLKEEIAFIRNYVEIQQIRYGKEAFSFEVIMEDTIDTYLVPTLIIHNFVENAITHAVSLDNHVEITLYIVNENYEDGEYLYICISDTGTGFPPDILDAIEQDTPIYYNDRKHIGIQNSLKRLKLIYGEKAKINFSNMDEGYGAVVEITIPVQKEQNTGTNKDRV
ncbi:sensor histidine kinase [Eisenbergiella tayi]|uniref:Sensor histidine kinase YpdA n=1 Tax=Eisenbergiella tayi TaxID=1432052 RepID=A0A1E3A864_9FIRM|nr:histidine kinase [Eisenbergiella tayi]ODM04962.1 Sensor histidine kinase YpdA [Eisenbergiella tayi]